jgi:hypothetical protein
MWPHHYRSSQGSLSLILPIIFHSTLHFVSSPEQLSFQVGPVQLRDIATGKRAGRLDKSIPRGDASPNSKTSRQGLGHVASYFGGTGATGSSRSAGVKKRGATPPIVQILSQRAPQLSTRYHCLLSHFTPQYFSQYLLYVRMQQCACDLIQLLRIHFYFGNRIAYSVQAFQAR